MDNVDQVLSTSIQARVPLALVGDPGVGKTARVSAVAASLGYHLETLIAGDYTPADLTGFPVPTADGRVVMSPLPWAQRVHDAGGRAILFLDELSNAELPVQAAALRVVHERRSGDLDLGDCAVVIALNPASSSVTGGDLAAAAANRVTFVDVVADVDTWQTWVASAPDTESVNVELALLAGFLGTSRNLLHMLPTSEVDRARAWPSPRSWHNAARLLAVAGRHTELAQSLLAGAVGIGAASHYVEWLAQGDLPTPGALLSGVPLPERSDRIYAVLGSLVSYVIARLETPEAPDLWTRVWHVMSDAADGGHTALASLSVRQLVLAAVTRNDLTLTPEMIAPYRAMIEAAYGDAQ